MSISYNLNIPLETNAPSQDQPNMKTNTNSVNSIIDVDHYTFSSNNAGKHKKSTYIAASAPGSASGALVAYAKTSSGASELFFQKDGTATEVQMTRGYPSVAANGYSFLPGGLLIQWASAAAITTGTAFSFPTAFTSAVYSVTVTLVSSQSDYCAVSGVTTSGMTLRPSRNGTVYVIAIGV